MKNELSVELCEYLEYCGLSRRKIARCSGSTRMYHDLGLYGETAEEFLEVLRDDYHVDLSGLEFEKFFPYEFESSVFSTRIFPIFVPSVKWRRRHEYLPLTLAMMDEMMHTKQWQLVKMNNPKIEYTERTLVKLTPKQFVINALRSLFPLFLVLVGVCLILFITLPEKHNKCRKQAEESRQPPGQVRTLGYDKSGNLTKQHRC